jgi:hypothetical protein
MRDIHQACGPIVEAFSPDVIHLNSDRLRTIANTLPLPAVEPAPLPGRGF